MENVLGGLVIFLIIVLICREVACWYFKINHTITVLEEIRDLLKREQGIVDQVKVADTLDTSKNMGDILAEEQRIKRAQNS